MPGQPTSRRVRVAPLSELRAAFDAQPGIQCDSKLEPVAGLEGRAIMDDESDSTSQVQFESLGLTAWMPMDVLTDLTRRWVRVAPVEEVKAAIEKVHTLKWTEDYVSVCGSRVMVIEEDPSDDTSKVDCGGKSCWLPDSTLTNEEPERE